MRRVVTVEPHASLYVGGYAESTGASDGDTARGPEGFLIPGSTLKGALRESAVRLVNAAGRGHDLLRDLFGDEAAEHEGALRVGPLHARLEGATGDDFPDPTGVVSFRKNDFGDSQLRNLIAVAMETVSPAVVSNFVRYQMGRDTGGKSWRREQGGVPLGDRLITELEKGAVAQALDAISSFDGEAERKQLVRMELVRHFLGFASRYLKYLDLQRGK